MPETDRDNIIARGERNRVKALTDIERDEINKSFADNTKFIFFEKHGRKFTDKRLEEWIWEAEAMGWERTFESCIAEQRSRKITQDSLGKFTVEPIDIEKQSEQSKHKTQEYFKNIKKENSELPKVMGDLQKLTDKIKSGEMNWTPEELQLRSNFGKEIEKMLQS